MLGKREKRLTKELKKDGKKELHSRAIIVKLRALELGKTIAKACRGSELLNRHITAGEKNTGVC